MFHAVNSHLIIQNLKRSAVVSLNSVFLLLSHLKSFFLTMAQLKALCEQVHQSFTQLHRELESECAQSIQSVTQKRDSLLLEMQKDFDRLSVSIHTASAKKPKPVTEVVSLISDDEDDEIQEIQPSQSQQNDRLELLAKLKSELECAHKDRQQELKDAYNARVKSLENEKKQQQIILNKRHRDTIDRLKAAFEQKHNDKPVISLLSDDEEIDDSNTSHPRQQQHGNKDHMNHHPTAAFNSFSESHTNSDDYNQSEAVSNRERRHATISGKITGFQCEHCSYFTSNRQSLIIHRRSHTNERPFKCHLCDQTFTVKCNLKQHVRRIHTKDFSHHCQYCPRKFLFAWQLDEHHNMHTGAKPFKCLYCSMRFGQKSKLNKHLKIHEGYKCRICEMVFKEKWELKEHRDTVHDEEGFNNGARSQWFKYGCSVCRLRFKTKAELDQHSECHTDSSGLVRKQEDGQRCKLSTTVSVNEISISSGSVTKDESIAINDVEGMKDEKEESSSDVIGSSDCEEDSDISML